MDLKESLQDVSRGLMYRYTPEVWSIFVYGTTPPTPTDDDLAALADRMDAHFKAWSGGVSIAEYWTGYSPPYKEQSDE